MFDIAWFVPSNEKCSLYKPLGMYQISGIIWYLARNWVSGWIRYPVSVTKRYPVLSGFLYPVESHIQYYLVHYQLLPNTADLYGIYNSLLINCTLNQWVSDIKLTWQTLPSIIRYYPESSRICYPVFCIQWYLISKYIRYTESSKRMYPVHPYKPQWLVAISEQAIHVFQWSLNRNIDQRFDQ